MMRNVANRVDGRVHGKCVTLHARSIYTASGDVQKGAVPTEIELEALVRKLGWVLRHSSLTPILGVAKTGPSAYKLLSAATTHTLAMKLDTLYSLGRSLPYATAELWHGQAVAALAHLHSHGVVVGTLTPHNFIIDANGMPPPPLFSSSHTHVFPPFFTGDLKLHDYAFAAVHKSGLVDGVIGREAVDTLHTYLPPEIHGNPAVHRRILRERGHLWGYGGEASDAWSLGLILLELLVAPHCPWHPSGIELLHQKAAAAPSRENAALYDEVGRFSAFLLAAGKEGEEAASPPQPPPPPAHDGHEVVLDVSRRRVPAVAAGRPRVYGAALAAIKARGQELGEENGPAMHELVRSACRMAAREPRRRWVPGVLAARRARREAADHAFLSDDLEPAVQPAYVGLRSVELDGILNELHGGGGGAVSGARLSDNVPKEIEHALLRRRLKESRRPGKDAVDMLVSTYLEQETDMGLVLGSLETVKQNFLNTRTETLMRAAQKLVAACEDPHAADDAAAQTPPDAVSARRGSIFFGVGSQAKAPAAPRTATQAPVSETLALFSKKVKSSEESVLSLLRDRGMFAAVPKASVPLLFRTPALCTPSPAATGRGTTPLTYTLPRWRRSVTCDIPCAWFVSVTHTIAPPPLDAIEGVAGHSNYTAKLREQHGCKKQKISLRRTLLSSPAAPEQPAASNAQEETARAQRVRELLLRYPATRVEVVEHCMRAGIPPTLRCEVWAAALGVGRFGGLREAYDRIDVSMTSKDDDQIAKDVPRCHQYDPWLGSEAGKHKLGRILKKWSVARGHVGTSRYIQGMASLAAPFAALAFHDEPLAYAGYTALLSRYAYLACDPSSGYTLLRGPFYSLLAFHDAPLWAKIQELEMPEDVFLSRLRTHFAHDVPLAKIYVIWDALFLGHRHLVFAVAIALLAARRSTLLAETEVTEAAQVWKNSMLEMHVETYVERAQALLARTPPHLSGPPSYLEGRAPGDDGGGGHHHHPAPLPVAYLPRDEMWRMLTLPAPAAPAQRDSDSLPSPTSLPAGAHGSGSAGEDARMLVVNTSWHPKDAGLCDIRVPLHARPTEALLDRLEALMAGRFGVRRGPLAATARVRVAVTGFSTQRTEWGPPPRASYSGAHDLAMALCRRGFSGVAVCDGFCEPPPAAPATPLLGDVHGAPMAGWATPSPASSQASRARRTHFFTTNPVCVTEGGPLPGHLPEAVWRMVVEAVPVEEVFGLAGVCRGLQELLVKQQSQQVVAVGGSFDSSL